MISELEGVVLGIVHEAQPCTTYAVRKELTASPSTHWTASAGSVYPLLERLESAGLVASALDDEDGRGRRLLRVTSAGRAALRAWVLSGSDPDVAASVFDAVRARAFFARALTPRQREQFAARSLEALEAYLVAARKHVDRYTATGDPFGRLAALGAVYDAEARVRWMQEVVESLGTLSTAQD